MIARSIDRCLRARRRLRVVERVERAVDEGHVALDRLCPILHVAERFERVVEAGIRLHPRRRLLGEALRLLVEQSRLRLELLLIVPDRRCTTVDPVHRCAGCCTHTCNGFSFSSFCGEQENWLVGSCEEREWAQRKNVEGTKEGRVAPTVFRGELGASRFAVTYKRGEHMYKTGAIEHSNPQGTHL